MNCVVQFFSKRLSFISSAKFLTNLGVEDVPRATYYRMLSSNIFSWAILNACWYFVVVL